MIDLAVKWTLAAALAALVTRRVTPHNAAAAHRVWLAVLVTPVLWAAGASLLPPVAYVHLRAGMLPETLVSPAAGLRAGLLIVYVIVAAMLLLRTAMGVLAVYRLTRSARRTPSGDCAAFERIIGPAAQRVREGSLGVPVTAGFVAPLILLPAGWRSLPPDGLRAILHHEAAHVRRHDCAIALGCAVVEALFWFHPAAWIAAARVRWFAEMACDAQAADAMDHRSYAEALLSLAAGWTGAAYPRYAVMAGAETGIARRIHLLLDEMEQGGRRRVLVVVTAVITVIVLPLTAGLRFGGGSIAAGSGGLAGGHDAVHQQRHARH